MEKDKYKNLFQRVRDIVNNIDPMGLMGGAPVDEYDAEVGSIFLLLKDATDEKGFADQIKGVFQKSFGESETGKDDVYHRLAQEILEVQRLSGVEERKEG